MSSRTPDASAELRPLELVFVEPGQRVPKRRSLRGEHEVVIVGASPDGPSTRHAIQRIARLEREGRRIGQSEILVADAVTGAVLEARAALAVALVRHMTKAGVGDLTFIAEESCSRALRSDLLALVDTLLASMGVAGVGLHVQFRPAAAPMAPAGVPVDRGAPSGGQRSRSARGRSYARDRPVTSSVR